jgi:hypothetical protein
VLTRRVDLATLKTEAAGSQVVVYHRHLVRHGQRSPQPLWQPRPPHLKSDEKQLRARLRKRRDFVEEGGAWWEHVELAIRDGDKRWASALKARAARRRAEVLGALAGGQVP